MNNAVSLSRPLCSYQRTTQLELKGLEQLQMYTAIAYNVMPSNSAYVSEPHSSSSPIWWQILQNQVFCWGLTMSWRQAKWTKWMKRTERSVILKLSFWVMPLAGHAAAPAVSGYSLVEATSSLILGSLGTCSVFRGCYTSIHQLLGTAIHWLSKRPFYNHASFQEAAWQSRILNYW